MKEIKKEEFVLLLKKLTNDKRTLIIILSGVLGILMIAFSGTENKSNEKPTENSESDISLLAENYESKLENLISEIDGVGKVSVMITYESSNEKVYGKDESMSKEGESIKTDKEYIIIDSGSEEKGLELKEIYPKVQGVAVVCQGGDIPTVKNEITEMIMALFDINSKSISITSMER